MFKTPPLTELYETYRKKRLEWLTSCSRTNLFILGGSISGLVAGFFLEKAGIETVILSEDEQPGGQFIWKRGPVPIIHPAENILREVGYESAAGSPLWVQRTEILAFCTARYFAAGGLFLGGIKLENIIDKPPGFELSLTLNEEPLVITAEDGIVTAPAFQPIELSDDLPGVAHELMVQNTGRRPEGWVKAGNQVLTGYSAAEELLLINGHLLSGRKAAEIGLARRE